MRNAWQTRKLTVLVQLNHEGIGIELLERPLGA